MEGDPLDGVALLLFARAIRTLKGMEAYTARWVLPLDRPPLPGGIVVREGQRTVGIEPQGSRPARDLGDVALMPALVNAHTHLDLCGMAGLAPPSADFPAWLRQVIAHRRSRTAEQIAADIAHGIHECLRFGVTVVGDISGDGASWPLLAASPVRGIVYREVVGLTPERAAGAEETLVQWARTAPTAGLRPGVSPHAPYSVHRDLFRAAGRLGLPVCTHLAESRAELELLERRSGPFVDFLQAVGVWHPEGLVGSPEEVVAALSPATSVLLAHGNYLTPESKLPPHAVVVYCPRTHAAFGHPPHPVVEMLACGVRVVLGTDSLASNPDLDILAEVRFLHEIRPDIPVETLLRLATDAEVFGIPREQADWVGVPIGGGDPYAAVLASQGPRTIIIDNHNHY